MAKKVITCREMMDVFLAHKEEILKRTLEVLSFKMIEGSQDADGKFNYVLVCPYCHEEFNESYSVSVAGTSTRSIRCPHCGAYGQGIANERPSNSNTVHIAVKDGDDIYLSTCHTEYKLDSLGNVLEPTIKFGPFMGVYNTVSLAKTKYEFKNEKSWYYFSDSPDDYRKTARSFYSGLLYRMSRSSALFLGFDKIEETSADYRFLVSEGDKAKVKKKREEIVFPAELSEKPPEIRISGLMNITARFEASDLVAHTKSYTLHCHCCGQETN